MEDHAAEKMLRRKIHELGISRFIFIAMKKRDFRTVIYAKIKHWRGLKSKTVRNLIRFLAAFGDLIESDIFTGMGGEVEISYRVNRGINREVTVTTLTPFPVLIVNRTEDLGIAELPITFSTYKFIKRPLVFIVTRRDVETTAFVIGVLGEYPNVKYIGKINEYLHEFLDLFLKGKLEIREEGNLDKFFQNVIGE